MKASVTLVIPTLLVMRSQTSSLRDGISPYLMVSCAAVSREKIPRTFADRVPLFNKIVLTSLVGLLVCGCIDVGPSNSTERAWISAARAAVEAPTYALHPPLPASKAVLSSLSLLLICPLIARGKFKPELDFHAGASFQAAVPARIIPRTTQVPGSPVA